MNFIVSADHREKLKKKEKENIYIPWTYHELKKKVVHEGDGDIRHSIYSSNLQTVCDTRLIFKRSTISLNLGFSFS